MSEVYLGLLVIFLIVQVLLFLVTSIILIKLYDIEAIHKEQNRLLKQSGNAQTSQTTGRYKFITTTSSIYDTEKKEYLDNWSGEDIVRILNELDRQVKNGSDIDYMQKEIEK